MDSSSSDDDGDGKGDDAMGAKWVNQVCYACVLVQSFRYVIMTSQCSASYTNCTLESWYFSIKGWFLVRQSRVCWHQRNCLNHQVPWDMLLSYMIFFWPKWEWNGLFLYTDSGQDHRMMYVHINLVISYCPLPESQSTFRLPSCCQDCSSPFLEESSGEDDVYPQSRLSEYWPHEVWNEWASRNHIEELQQHCTLQKSRWAIA